MINNNQLQNKIDDKQEHTNTGENVSNNAKGKKMNLGKIFLLLVVLFIAFEYYIYVYLIMWKTYSSKCY